MYVLTVVTHIDNGEEHWPTDLRVKGRLAAQPPCKWAQQSYTSHAPRPPARRPSVRRPDSKTIEGLGSQISQSKGRITHCQFLPAEVK